MFSMEQNTRFLGVIKQLQQALDALNTEHVLQELERFENQLTLRELQTFFSDTSLEHREKKLIDLLAQRWERIRGSSMCYTQKPTNAVNQLCQELAIGLSSPINTESEIEALAPNTGPYCLLMPSLEKSQDVYGENIHSLEWHEFVLSEKECVFIPLVSCLEEASISDDGQFRHMVLIDETCPIPLSPNEIVRVSQHSKEARALYRAIEAYNDQRLLSNTIGAQLRQLAVALRKGGVGRGSGAELNAGSEANVGIVAFRNYWEGLTTQQTDAIFKKTPMLRDILGRLFRPEDRRYEETIYCVELLANKLDSIIDIYHAIPAIKKLKQEVDKQKRLFEAALKTKKDLVLIGNTEPPRHIFYPMYTLSAAEQKILLRHSGYNDVLMYVLACAPEALLEFTVDQQVQQKIAFMLNKAQPKDDFGLILAVQRGQLEVIKLLLSWGVSPTLQDTEGLTALHWAARCGHNEIVRYLLACGARLDAVTKRGNTPLHSAVIEGKKVTVELLLLEELNFHTRNTMGLNALDLARQYHPDLMEPILMYIAKQPVVAQMEWFLNVPGSSYPHVIFYVAAQNKLKLFHIFVMQLLENLANDPIGALREVLINTTDFYGLTILHWAARHGNREIVCRLLESGARVDAVTNRGNIPLHSAIIDGNRAAFDQLLEVSNLIVRNRANENALDLAIKYHPELINPILKHIAPWPSDKQQNFLSDVPGDYYPNVFFYAATINRQCLKDLLYTFNKPALDSKMESIHNLLAQMVLHYKQMKRKSVKNLQYRPAVSSARTLLITTINAMITVYQDSEDSDRSLQTFKACCYKAIETARPVLKKHREWTKVLAAFLLAVITLPVSLSLYAAGFFSLKTKSEQLLDNLQRDVYQCAQ